MSRPPEYVIDEYGEKFNAAKHNKNPCLQKHMYNASTLVKSWVHSRGLIPTIPQKYR